MMKNVMRKQIYMVVGYMLRIKAWFIVKLWTWWYYVTHPNMWWKRTKLRIKLWRNNEG